MGSDRPVPPILIRADAGAGLGNGHVMRCLALGQAAREKGGRVAFLGRVGSADLERRLRAEGFACRFLPAAHRHPIDLAETLAQLAGLSVEGEPAPWLVLDGYQFDPNYMRAVRSAGWPLLVVDDHADRGSYAATILFNQNLGAERLAYRTDPDTEVLAGVRYVLLRRQFRAGNGPPRSFPATAGRILVTLGGGDPDNVTEKVLGALNILPSRELEVVAVVGSNNPHLVRLSEAVRRLTFPVRIVRDAEDMPALMAWADLAISAAGSTTWELAFLGLPALLLILAKNQEEIARELDGVGAAINLGWASHTDEDRIARALTVLGGDRDRRESMAARGRSLVDGKGVWRVLDVLSRRSSVPVPVPGSR
jgi:UDP-2,4-diacetamido-2,4,6-trideoxy-beta-L-altropyranose hydrolase